jgi:nucleoside-diphosphate-sugar epimerase
VSRIIVSGATGFLGFRLCQFLKNAGFEVTGLGRDKTKGTALEAVGADFTQIDLSQTSNLDEVDDAEGFVHAAGLSSAFGRRQAFMRANVTGTQNALRIAESLGVRRFVFISSPSVYFRFADQFGVDEDTRLPKPVNAYAASKRLAEDYVRRSDLNSLILRPRGLYGPGDRALLPRLLRAAARGPLPLLRRGIAMTDLTFVDDVCEAILAALAAPCACGGKTYNISSGEPVLLTEIIRQAAVQVGIEVSFRPFSLSLALGAARLAEAAAACLPHSPEPPLTAYGVGVLAYSQTLNIERARRDLGFAPKVPFAEGLTRTFADVA